MVVPAARSDWFELKTYFPTNVKHLKSLGGSNFIGVVDDDTVLKYPHRPGETQYLDMENRIYRHLGRHPHIVEHKGMTADGLLLAFARNGSLKEYLRDNTTIDLNQKVKWSIQIAEAVQFIHSKGVIHCDINPSNFLLDEHLIIKMCDLQGRLLDADDSHTIIDIGASEYSKYRLPSAQENDASELTDIFALGSVIYYIFAGHGPFPDLDIFADDKEIRHRFQSGNYPDLSSFCTGNVIRKCWQPEYTSAQDVVNDLTEHSS